MRNILFWLCIFVALLLVFSQELAGLPVLIQTHLGVSRDWAFGIILAGIGLAVVGAYLTRRRA